MNLKKYRSIIFDCDGVLLDSNAIKTQAFFDISAVHGNEIANLFIEYHRANGGLSRYEKIRYLHAHILQNEVSEYQVVAEAAEYGRLVKGKLITCSIATGLDRMRTLTENAEWSVVSGSDQKELRDVFELNGLNNYFEGRVFGSPRSKVDIINDGKAKGKFAEPALFIGDSRYDYETSIFFGFDFVFLSAWSEWRIGEEHVAFPRFKNISELTQSNEVSPPNKVETCVDGRIV